MSCRVFGCLFRCVVMFYFVLSRVILFFKQKTAYEMRISDWSSDVCSSDLSPADDKRFSGSRRHGRGSAGDEIHLRAKQFDAVACLQLARMRADLSAVDQRSAGPCFAADVDAVVAVGTSCDRGNLYDGLADRGQRFRRRRTEEHTS